ncbi:MAG: outer membrane beta-barrel protein [Desulfatitalea sp.]
MKKLVLFTVVLAILAAWSGAALAAGAEGNINLLLGKKFMDDDVWDDLDIDEQTAIGLMFDIKPSGWPIALAADFLKTEEEAHGIDGETQEIDLGVRWYSNPINRIVRFYAGGGLGLIDAEIEGENDDEFGVWLNGGIAFTIVQHLNLGLDLRYSRAEVELNGEDIEAGGLTTCFLIGYHF